MNIIEKSQLLSTDKFQETIEYWKSVFADEYTTVSIFSNSINDKGKKLKSESFSINSMQYFMLTEKCKNDISLFTYLFTTHAILVNKLTGENKFYLCMPQLTSTKKTYNKALPIPVNFNLVNTFKDLLLHNKDSITKTYQNNIYPLNELNDNLKEQVYFKNLVFFSGLHSEHHVDEIENMTEHEISLRFSKEEGVLQYNFIYNSAKYDHFSIQQIAKLFAYILSQSLDNINISLENIKLVEEIKLIATNYEKEVILENIVELFEKQVENCNGKIAVVCPTDISNIYRSLDISEPGTSLKMADFVFDKLTYQELNEKANQLANYLVKSGVQTNEIVALILNPTIVMVAGIWAILKAGGTFLPISPDTPLKRLDYMLTDSGCKILITHDYLKSQFSFFKEVIDIDNLDLSKEQKANLDVKIDNEQPAYMIYTSGTTGRPKGVVLKHENIANYTKWFCDCYKLNKYDKTALLSSYAFDLGYTSLFTAILKGGEIHIVPKDIYTSPSVLINYINNEGLTYLKLTPSLFSTIIDCPEFSSSSLKSMKNIILGGEKIRMKDVKSAYSICNDLLITNHYGPTEATIGCITHQIKRDELENNNDLIIGHPIKNTNAYVLNPNNQILPDGLPGELCISGSGLAKGYQNQALLTKEKFTVLKEYPLQRIYKTGDLARKLPDGAIEFLGRIDGQVKIRGFRVELEEIESTINKVAEISINFVLVKKDKNGNQQLVSYFVQSKDRIELSIDKLRKKLTETLPDYMIPSLFVKLETMPLTPNGKIDKKALPDPEGIIETSNKYVAPKTETEKDLANIWKDVLRIEKIGINDNFIELGGDSIIAIQVVSRARQKNIYLTPTDIFKNQTIAELAKVSNTNGLKTIAEQGLVSGEIALTPIQSWFFEEDFENKNHWNQAVMLKVKGSVEISVVEKAINALVQQHDVLRLAYTIEKGKWVQQHNERLKYQLEIVDCSNLLGEELSKSIEEHSTKIQGSLSVENGVLFKAALFKTNNDNELLVAINHLVVDGVSWRIIIEDLQKACLQQISNREIDLGLKTSSFKQWTEKLTGYANSDKLAKELTFWDEITSKLNSSLSFDYSGENTGASAKNITVKLNKKLTQQLLKEAGKAYKTEINDLLLTSLTISIEKWTGNSNVTINLEGHGREEIFIDTDISRTVGWFTTQFPVYLTLEKENSLAGKIKSIKEQLRSIPNKGIGYGILRYLHPDVSVRERLNLKKNNEIGFNYLGQFDNLQENSGFISLSNQPSGVSISNANHRVNIIDINSLISDGELVINCTYSENLHKKETIENLANSYIVELQNIVEHCLQPESKGYTPSDFPLCELSQEEIDNVLIKRENIEIKNSKKIKI